MKLRKRTALLLSLLLISLFAVSVYAAHDSWLPVSDYVTDQAGLFSAGERQSLEEQAFQISRKHNVGVYIITVDSGAYADSGLSELYDSLVRLYDENDLGMGEDRAGVCFLLNISTREYVYDSYSARVQEAFPEASWDGMEARFLPYFRDNDFFGGFREYLNCCDSYLTAAEEGHPVGGTQTASGGFKFSLTMLLPGLGLALVAGVSLCAPMKTARQKQNANDYTVSGSLNIYRRSDVFINRTVTRRPRNTEHSGSNSGGHSGSHFSSGGHSGGGGRF